MDNFEERVRLAETLRRAGVRGRYAPSPTGQLHLGNLRTALLAWLQARLTGGAFILRVEDLDQPRTRAGCAEQIVYDLHWLGLDWDEGPDCGGPSGPYSQHERQALYGEALRRLNTAGRLFPCFCSRKDIAQAISAPQAGDDTSTYPGTCRNLSPDERHARQRARLPAWRFRSDTNPVAFQDAIAGAQTHSLSHEIGDFVVRRADGLFAYQLAVVVDDWLMGITDVVRGLDLLSSTARQISLFDTLGASLKPQYWHVPLLFDATGKRLSKRDGANSLATLRACDESPASIVGQLAASVHLVPPGSVLSAQELRQELTLQRFTKTLREAFESPQGRADTESNPL